MIRRTRPNYPVGTVNTFYPYRTSILRPHELIEIRGSYWPRILVLSESAERKKKTTSKAAPLKATKVSRKLKKKEMIRKLKKISPTPSPIHRPVSPSFEASPDALSISISAFDQNNSWKPCTPTVSSKTKTSSFTGRPLVSHHNIPANHLCPTTNGQSGLKGPSRRKSKSSDAPR